MEANGRLSADGRSVIFDIPKGCTQFQIGPVSVALAPGTMLDEAEARKWLEWFKDLKEYADRQGRRAQYRGMTHGARLGLEAIEAILAGVKREE